MSYEEFIKIFPFEKDRKVLGCINKNFAVTKCYYVGGEGKYKSSINACDEEGSIYPVYELFELPIRICIVVDKDIVEKIQNLNDIELDNFYENDDLQKYVYKKIKNYFDLMRTESRIFAYKNDLVKIGDELIYIDYQGNEHNIKNINNIKNISIGDYVFYGNVNHIIEDDKIKNIDKKIIWRVVDKYYNIITLHSVFVINREKEEDEYKDSKLREWLNNEFLQKAFTDEERSRIVKTITRYKSNTGSIIKLNDKIATLTEEIINEKYTETITKNIILSPTDLTNEYILNLTDIEEDKINILQKYDYLQYIMNDDADLKSQLVYIENSSFKCLYSGRYYNTVYSDMCGVLPIISLKIENENNH